MAYQQKFTRLTDKSRVVPKGAMAGICPCGAAFCHRFSWSIIIPVSSATRGRIVAGVYLPLSKIILIHNPFQMSYWLGEASLPFSIRGFYLQYTYTDLVSQHLSPRQQEKDRDIWKTDINRDLPGDGTPPLTAILEIRRLLLCAQLRCRNLQGSLICFSSEIMLYVKQ